MILSASRRTDIPAFYGEWFIRRLEEGNVLVRNPMNYRQVSRIEISPSIVDCIVFWTKNPAGIMDKLDIIHQMGHTCYFLFTLTSYAQDIEINVPKKKYIIETFVELSKKLGKDRVIWRYDPILITEEYSVEYHLRYFETLAEKLSGFTRKCLTSFMTMYRKIEKNLHNLSIRLPGENEKADIYGKLKTIAEKYQIELETCAEPADLEKYGIKRARCIDIELISKITGKNMKAKKDKNQREACGCAESIDIGAYDTCPHNCVYCYANLNRKFETHNPDSPILIGDIEPEDIITDRKVRQNPTMF